MDRTWKDLIYRSWRYFRTGFATYISTPLSISNFLILSYSLAGEIPLLNIFFVDFIVFAIFGLIWITPLGILLGYVHMKKMMIYGTEAIVSAEANPVTAYSNMVTMEMAIKLYKEMGIPISDDWMRLLDFWRKVDRKWRWRP